MSSSAAFLSGVTLCLLGSSNAHAGIAFPDPPGGWTYIYDASELIIGAPNSGMTSLDGTWAHDSSDQWDGSQLGGTFSTGGFGVGNGPGGASLLTNSTGTTFLRLQDTGDPTAFGFPDPNNRKIYFGHDIGLDMDPSKALTIMDDGVTLSFRARIPTLAKAGGPLDPTFPAGQEANGAQPYPTGGDGYLTSDSGKGNFVIHQGGNGDVPGGAIAFSLSLASDKPSADPGIDPAGVAGLNFNELNGDIPMSKVAFGQGRGASALAFDPTEWHEVYIVLRRDPDRAGTHEVFVFVDGNPRPFVYKTTAGTGVDSVSPSYIAMGGSATPQSWALDVDWFGYKGEPVFPPGAQFPPILFNFVPATGTMFYPIESHFSFSATALSPTNTLPANGFKVVLNGQDVSSQLALTGTDSAPSRSAVFRALQPNMVYEGTVTVTDSAGLSTTNGVSFDTFVDAGAIVLEAENYNFGRGQFVEDPSPGAYQTLGGVQGIDFYDTTPASLGGYRPDEVDTAVTADTPRVMLADCPDYRIGAISRGEWWNYTCTLSNASYSLWVRFSSTAFTPQEIRVDRVSGDPSQTNQTLDFLGTLRAASTGNPRLFSYVQLADLQGRPIAMPLSGTNTLRLTAASANNDLELNFFLLLPVSAPADPTVSASPSANDTAISPDTRLEIAIFDGCSPVNEQTVTLRVNGTNVAATVTKVGGVTSVRYMPTEGWTPGIAHALSLTFSDSTNRSFNWSFTTLNAAIRATLSGSGKVVLEWRAGTLQSAETLNGPYQPVAGALSPYEVDPAGARQQFYRVLVR